MERMYTVVAFTLGCLPLTDLRGQDSLRAACDAASTTYQMRQCASRDLTAARAELDRYLAEARRVAAKRPVLDSAQSAWERYRDISCRSAASEYEGGTMQPLVEVSCLAQRTRARIRELYESYLRAADTSLPEPKND